jgi:hypothetical protein
MTAQEFHELKKAYGKRQANPAEVLRLLNAGRKAVGLKPLKEIPKGSNPERDTWGPLCAVERAFPGATQGWNDDFGCQFCHRHTGYVIWGGCVEGKEAALMRAWGVKSERMSESIGVLLPAMLNQFSSEYAAGLWLEFVDDELICLGDDDLNERIAEAQRIEVTAMAELPDAIPAGYGDCVWMHRDKIAKYLLSADDAKYLCGKAA